MLQKKTFMALIQSYTDQSILLVYTIQICAAIVLCDIGGLAYLIRRTVRGLRNIYKWRQSGAVLFRCLRALTDSGWGGGRRNARCRRTLS